MSLADDNLKAGKMELAKLGKFPFLENLERVDHVVRQTVDVEDVLGNVLDTVLEITGGDRVYLLYPCDPSERLVSVPMESTASGWMGVREKGESITVTPRMRDIFRVALESGTPLRMDPGSPYAIPEDISLKYNILSMMMLVVKPRTGKPWLFGVQQCSRARIWEEPELIFFQEVGRRVGDILNSYLYYMDLKDSREKYRAMMDAMTDLVYICNEDLRIEYMNPAMIKWAGRDATGEPCYKVLYHFAEKCPWCVKDMVLKGENHRMEVKNPFNGRIYDVSNFPVYNRLGQGSVMVIVRDITDRKIAEKELRRYQEHLEELVALRTLNLRESELKYRRLIESMPGSFFFYVQDMKGEITFVSPTVTNMLGYSVEEFMELGKSMIWSCPASGVGQGAESRTFEIPVAHRDGGTRILEVHEHPVLDSGGNVVSVEGFAQDITRRRADEKVLRLARDEAERANRAKSEFLANMSHEIRTPLNAVMGFSELLFYMTRDPKQKNCINGIIAAGKNLLLLINDILDLSRIEAGMMEVVVSRVPVRKIFEDMQKIFRLEIERKGLEFRLEIDDQLPEILVLDETRFRQILFNLVGNAVKFTDSGFVKIGASCSLKKNSLLDLDVSIEDSGVGISGEDLGVIFDSFRQAGDTSMGQTTGSGLGLSICKRLIELMGGEIRVTSKKGLGSRFDVMFKDVCFAGEVLGDKEKQDSGFSFLDFTGSKVLVVDDVRSNRELVKMLLSRLGIEVIVAQNGKEAVCLAGEHHPDLVIMDLRMPVMDGNKAAACLKSSKDTATVPIIALTTTAIEDQGGVSCESPFDGYLVKPLNLELLVLELKRFLKYHEKAAKTSDLTDIKHVIGAMKQDMKRADSNMINEIRSLVWPEFESLSGVLNVKSMEKGCEKLLSVGEKYAAAGVMDFSRHLMFVSGRFDMTAVQRMLNVLRQEFTGTEVDMNRK